MFKWTLHFNSGFAHVTDAEWYSRNYIAPRPMAEIEWNFCQMVQKLSRGEKKGIPSRADRHEARVNIYSSFALYPLLIWIFSILYQPRLGLSEMRQRQWKNILKLWIWRKQIKFPINRYLNFTQFWRIQQRIFSVGFFQCLLFYSMA